MRVVIWTPSPEIAATISVAASLAVIECETAPTLQAFCSGLFRDPDCVGLFWSPGPASAAETVRRMRLADVRNPIFVLLDDEVDAGRAAVGRILALSAGVDDIQHWPTIDPREIVARLQALHRREMEADHKPILMAGVVFNPEQATITTPSGEVIHLTRQEGIVLETIARHPNTCVSKNVIMLALYNQRDEAVPKIVDVYVCKLRRKIVGATGGLDCIETEYGNGYRFIPEGFPVGVIDGRRLAVVK